MVAKMIDEQRIREAILIPFFFSKCVLFIIAKWQPSELYTCMLGHKLVGVSVLYSIATMWVNILSLGMVAGLKFCPFGHRVETNKKMVIPVKRKVQHL